MQRQRRPPEGGRYKFKDNCKFKSKCKFSGNGWRSEDRRDKFRNNFKFKNNCKGPARRRRYEANSDFNCRAKISEQLQGP
jgi:hypothetical protein